MVKIQRLVNKKHEIYVWLLCVLEVISCLPKRWMDKMKSVWLHFFCCCWKNLRIVEILVLSKKSGSKLSIISWLWSKVKVAFFVPNKLERCCEWNDPNFVSWSLNWSHLMTDQMSRNKNKMLGVDRRLAVPQPWMVKNWSHCAMCVDGDVVKETESKRKTACFCIKVWLVSVAYKKKLILINLIVCVCVCVWSEMSERDDI